MSPCADVDCPTDFECEVSCEGDNACHQAVITCSDYACTVGCDGPNACHDAEIRGGHGSVSVTCGNDSNACNGLRFDCECGQSECD
jgi:hypothetical protein